MSTQLATQHNGNTHGYQAVEFGKDQYVYDIEKRTGLAMPKIWIDDIAGQSAAATVKDMASAMVCPVATGATVASTTGGVVAGYDMYGQYINETVGAAGTSAIAFATIISAPADATWANEFGLPYKYSAAAATPNADVTITAADEGTGDERGTWTYGGALTGPVEVEVPYMVDRTNIFGDAYASRYATAAFSDQTLAITATLDLADGTAAVTIAASTPAGAAATVTFADGYTVRAAAGDVVNHTMSPLWLSKYGDVIDAAAADRLVAVGFDDSSIDAIYADVTLA